MKKGSSVSSQSESNLNHFPSVRSRKSVLKGSPAFVWSNEVTRTDEPYYDKRYHIPHDLPPNEVNFVGGLGKIKGHARSKLHPNRPTTLQKLYGMTSRNKIAVTFTQPHKDSHCLAQKTEKLIERQSPKVIKSVVRQVTSADFIITPSSSNASDCSENIKLMKKKVPPCEHTEDNTINGVPFYYPKDGIKSLLNDFLSRTVDKDDMRLPHVESNELDFRKWAVNMRDEIRKERAGSSTVSNSISDRSSAKTIITGSKYSRKNLSKVGHKNIVKHLSGYMFGPFAKTPTPDELTKDGDKFGIPRTMTERAKRYHKKHKIQHNVLRRVRLSHMGFVQPPSKDESSDDNESVQEVKKLALIRTPYFIIPTIRISQVKKKDRFRNKFLRGDRLKRINLLMDDRSKSQSKPKNVVETDEDIAERKRSMFAKFFQLIGKKDAKGRVEQEPKEIGVDKTNYLKLIRENFVKNRDKYEIDEEEQKPLTFDEFKERDSQREPNTPVKETKNSKEKDSTTERPITMRNRFEVIKPKELFKRKKNEKISKYDEIVGPFYVDPNLMDKFRSPKKYKKPHKYYTNLIKGKFWTRDRLQVNAPEFNQEKVGQLGQEYFNRLATELDEFYIHELRHRPPTRKFCVKTDIITLQQIARRNFNLYYIQENLIELKAKQIAENKLMNEAEEFAELCKTLFTKWKSQAFDEFNQKVIQQKQLEVENKLLAKQHCGMLEEFKKLSKDIFLVEEKWNELMTLQNYYYILQDSEWRQKNDWIHVDTNGAIQSPLQAIDNCKIRNIRRKIDCCGFSIKNHFDNEINIHLDRMKSILPSTDLLKKNLEILKQKAFDRVIQHNRTFWMYKQINIMCSKLMVQLNELRVREEEKIKMLKKRKEFMENRAQMIKENTQNYITKSIPGAAKSLNERTILSICSQLYNHLVPKEMSADTVLDNTTPIDKFKFIHQFALDIFQQLDTIPVDILRSAEQLAKENRKRIAEQTRLAVIKQKRFDLLKKQLRNQFTAVAPFKRVTITTERKSLNETKA
ncbi:hypothetical protein Bhyg_08173 [Pseudolycoriella hygida]|uniref:Uncharacterized protein n=1 Tax=Pseudolycoriella hygida TaxID=35572 RepID=A0A9Q0N4C3_9DIPT|nr:hypothetical protein Bhyg_08173 [Pseudolycoriella hygida]